MAATTDESNTVRLNVMSISIMIFNYTKLIEIHLNVYKQHVKIIFYTQIRK